jgi:hypothetical protein
MGASDVDDGYALGTARRCAAGSSNTNFLRILGAELRR